MKSFTDGITQHSRVVLATKAPGGELVVGDTGTVIAAWGRPLVAVRWDKDGRLRPVHRKRLRLILGEPDKEIVQ